MAERKRIKAAEEVVETTEPLHIKYRPKKLSEVLGHHEIVKSFGKALKASARPHSFLFEGPAGTGKTTFARLGADLLGCSVVEIDAASNSGIDAMREVISTTRYHAFGNQPNKAYIIDEAHGLSKQAWDSLLKTVEEPPEHVFFFFCTTAAGKIPKSIESRCVAYALKPLRYDDLMDLLTFVCEEEKLQTPDKVLQLVARESGGSPRMALTMLAKVAECEEVDEAAPLLASAVENPDIIELARKLVGGKLDWKDVTSVLKANESMGAESVRIVIVAYLCACAMGANSDKSAARLLDMLHAFREPCNPQDKMAPLLLAFGDFIFR